MRGGGVLWHRRTRGKPFGQVTYLLAYVLSLGEAVQRPRPATAVVKAAREEAKLHVTPVGCGAARASPVGRDAPLPEASHSHLPFTPQGPLGQRATWASLKVSAFIRAGLGGGLFTSLLVVGWQGLGIPTLERC